MGVSGCGKTALGTALSKKIVRPFHDADDFHNTQNIEKMRTGNALTDEDRVQWLDKIGRAMKLESTKSGAVLACSALKQKYRQQLEHIIGPQVVWIYMKGSIELITQRLATRKDHFFNASLLASQFEILEEPLNAVYVDCRPDTESQLAALLLILGYPFTSSSETLRHG